MEEVSQPALTVEESEAALRTWLPLAEGGDFVAMAYVAMLMHLSSHSPESEINNWIRRAMVSDDPEFLINLGEELVIGSAIYRNVDLAEECFKRSLALSELMGSYALARFSIGVDRKRSLNWFKRAADLGHIPSRHLLNSLQLPKRGLLRKFLALRYLPSLIRETREAHQKGTIALRWWRYRDVFPDEDQSIRTELGEDRQYHFSWARPLSMAQFAAVCRNEKGQAISRGVIEMAAPLPRTG